MDVGGPRHCAEEKRGVGDEESAEHPGLPQFRHRVRSRTTRRRNAMAGPSTGINRSSCEKCGIAAANRATWRLKSSIGII
jgi:hypothetical protein